MKHQQQGHCCCEHRHMPPITPDAAASKWYCTLLLFETLDSVLLLQQLIAPHVCTRALFLVLIWVDDSESESCTEVFGPRHTWRVT